MHKTVWISTISHVPGESLIKADALSRAPKPRDQSQQVCPESGVSSTPETPLLLCPKHYALLYRQFKAVLCAGCGIMPKQEICFSLHTPDASNVSIILEELNCSGNVGRLNDYD